MSKMAQENLSEAMKDFDGLNEKLQANHASRVKLLTQHNENSAVLRELEAVATDCTVYKIVGPVLVRTERDDAVSNVNKRLEYVNSDLIRCDKMELDLKKQVQEAARRVETLQKKMVERQRQQQKARV